MPTFRYVLADVFTDKPLEGNGLAVFTDARELPEETLQPLARELNLSETVFVYPPGGIFRLRDKRFEANRNLGAREIVISASFPETRPPRHVPRS